VRVPVLGFHAALPPLLPRHLLYACTNKITHTVVSVIWPLDQIE
jgi:hypothetical protein